MSCTVQKLTTLGSSSYDYTGFSDASRASIQMTHTSNGPTVSYDEAQRMERETAQHLHTVRKLSLIVDLDQTIVHATVDPTVGEWIAEGEAWEARRAKREADGLPLDDDDDEVNPNWEALKDVKKFRLGPEALGQLYWGRMGLRQKPKKQSVEVEGCMYYIKPRCVGPSPACSQHLSFVAHFMRFCAIAAPGTKSFWRTWRPSTRCMCTRWARAHTPRRSAPRLTPTARYSVVVCSAAMRVEVSLRLYSRSALALTHLHCVEA